jgi:hypothetical protein
MKRSAIRSHSQANFLTRVICYATTFLGNFHHVPADTPCVQSITSVVISAQSHGFVVLI